jgi:vacuolar-type H+-ATPase subunit H
MKDVGAGITYARRYSLTMVLGIASEDDNDIKLLNEASKNAIKFAYNRARKNIDEAETVKQVEGAQKILKDDQVQLEKGKAPALGLSEEQYKKLISNGDVKKKQIEENDKETKNE